MLLRTAPQIFGPGRKAAILNFVPYKKLLFMYHEIYTIATDHLLVENKIRDISNPANKQIIFFSFSQFPRITRINKQ